MPPRRTFTIRDPDQLLHMTSPVRQEIVDAVETCGPCSVGEIAELLGRPAKSLHYHFRILTQAGLLQVRGSRETVRRDETMYCTPGYPMVAYFDATDEVNVEIISKGMAALIRIASRDFLAALRAGIGRVRGRSRNMHALRRRCWLTRTDVDEVYRHFDAITEIIDRGSKPPKSHLHSVTILLSPIAPKTIDD